MAFARRPAALLLTSIFCATVLVAASGSVPAAQAAPVTTPAVTEDAVIPPDPPSSTVDDYVAMAGATGFLHQYNFSSQYLWTDYATGTTAPVPILAGVNLGWITPAGGDTISFWGTWPFNPAGDVSELDLADMTWQHWALPTDEGSLGVLGVFGNSALVAAHPGGVLTWQVVTFAQDGTDTMTTVSGIPAGANIQYGQPRIGDASAALVRYGVSGGVQYGLLDLATAIVTPIPDPDLNYQALVLSADSVGLYDPSTEVVRVYSRAGLTGGSDTAAQTVTLPGAAGYRIALAGDHVIAVADTSECLYCSYTIAPALDVPLSGTPAGQALPQAQTGTGALAQAPGGAAVVVGGTGPADWSVRRLTVDGSDNLSDTAVLPLTGPITNGGLTISQGLVRHIEVEPTPGGPPNYLMFNHMLVGNSGGYGIDPRLNGGTLAKALPCAPGAACVHTVDGNGYGTSFLASGTATSAVLREQIDANTSSMSLSLPSAGGTIVDAAPGYVIVQGTDPTALYVVDVGHETILSNGPVTGAALWYGTLWRSDGAGYLQATNLETHTTYTPIATGADCTAREIQATRRWIYWSCGASGPAGVYDRFNRASIPVPAGPMLLGDGYLVRHDPATGDLNMYDVHSDVVSGPVTLANVPAGTATDDRGITWAVDKYSGGVAYVDAGDSVHVINTGVPTTPPTLGDPPASWLSMAEIYFSKYGAWVTGLALTRPVTSWTLTFRRFRSGPVVHTASGGPARAGISAYWNGYLPNGTKAYSGLYTWWLSVTLPGMSTSFTIPGSTLRVECGQIPFRSYDCGGESALLADKGGSQGYSYWYNGTVTGGLRNNGYTENWPLCSYNWCVSAIVPFGDFNGDGYADLLVRYRSGVLRAYLGIGQADFNSEGTKSIKLGTGWNAYNALAYPGDLTGNGKPDLVARDGKGRLWLFAGTGKGSFRSRAEISSGWGKYRRLVGAGDLGGIGDLLAIDKYGVMWRFNGNGKGGFTARHYVSSGWSRYNAVIGIGDLSLDGRCNDLVARDGSGTLWRFNGNCKGGFAKRTEISTGWGKYQRLF